jgi:alkanesulfonate monooxygenase SsuD/methylene tetrahydromethanopterin reductase-like flavin-dependent oxidoreductase (luciferase family)
MQFGVYVHSGHQPEAQLAQGQELDALVLARAADELGWDVFGLAGPAAPVLLAGIAAQTQRLQLVGVTPGATTDPVVVAESYAMVQHLARGRLEVVVDQAGGPDWGTDLAIENSYLLHQLWEEPHLDWEGRYHAPLLDFTALPRPLDAKPPRVWQATQDPALADWAAWCGDGLLVDGDSPDLGRTSDLVAHYRQCATTYRGTSARPLITVVTRLAPAPQLLDQVATCRDQLGDYQRHLLVIDPAQPLWVTLRHLSHLTPAVLPVLHPVD